MSSWNIDKFLCVLNSILMLKSHNLSIKKWTVTDGSNELYLHLLEEGAWSFDIKKRISHVFLHSTICSRDDYTQTHTHILVLASKIANGSYCFTFTFSNINLLVHSLVLMTFFQLHTSNPHACNAIQKKLETLMHINMDLSQSLLFLMNRKKWMYIFYT